MRTLGILLTISLATAMAQDKAKQGKMPPPPPLKLSIAAFSDGGDIPVKFTCSAQPSAVSPAMQWSMVPNGTVTFAMILHDPDVAMRRNPDDVIHWMWWNVPASATGLPEGVPTTAEIAGGGVQGNNVSGKPGFFGPCPPPTSPHHYTFELYALDTKLDLAPAASRPDLLKAMEGHILSKAVYIGMFHR
jgi:Raf kinase inhibitor-like YbhB/YbcL family protein